MNAENDICAAQFRNYAQQITWERKKRALTLTKLTMPPWEKQVVFRKFLCFFFVFFDTRPWVEGRGIGPWEKVCDPEYFSRSSFYFTGALFIFLIFADSKISNRSYEQCCCGQLEGETRTRKRKRDWAQDDALVEYSEYQRFTSKQKRDQGSRLSPSNSLKG